jgi:predicted outer membrane repeat protein
LLQVNSGATLNLSYLTQTEGTAVDGGGVYNFLGTMTVINSTFADNQAGLSGGGIYNNDGTLDLEVTILASSTGGNCADFTINDEGYNLSDDGSCSFTATGSENNVANLDLGSLQFNGDPTETISIDSSSAAYDSFPVADCTYQNVNPCTNPPTSSDFGPLVCDQRGITRPHSLGHVMQAHSNFKRPIRLRRSRPA